jgi:hypothetical protein
MSSLSIVIFNVETTERISDFAVGVYTDIFPANYVWLQNFKYRPSSDWLLSVIS